MRNSTSSMSLRSYQITDLPTCLILGKMSGMLANKVINLGGLWKGNSQACLRDKGTGKKEKRVRGILKPCVVRERILFQAKDISWETFSTQICRKRPLSSPRCTPRCSSRIKIKCKIRVRIDRTVLEWTSRSSTRCLGPSNSQRCSTTSLLIKWLMNSKISILEILVWITTKILGARNADPDKGQSRP